ncbi:MAG: endonuclease MutS2 [Candidatus Lernaella stagnicola]|nr:endonuclease MutS2 [Candidatus Lernaella stagnicola]
MSPYAIGKAAALVEWDRLLTLLAKRATSELGGAACLEVELAADVDAARAMMSDVSEARELLLRSVELSFADVRDIGPIGKRARVGSALEGTDLLAVAALLRLSRKTRALLEEESERLPRLAQRANLLPAESLLEKEIFARIERDGRVADNASPELRQLRDRYRVVHDQIHATLERMIAGPDYEDILQERIFTLRNGRFVVPVKVERKGTLDGIVHDISQTGQSVYIEPRQITHLNNRLRTAELEIDREIHRILLELTYKVAEVIDELEEAIDVMTALDVIFAKARLADDLKAHPVEATKSGTIFLPAMRHPLLALQMDNVIPNDVVAEDVRTLVLSGPNTGGKTVLLKSIGLCALMLRAGLHLPCGPDGRMPVFRRVFAVIGDEQSIEANLSSFSSHLLNLKYIVDELVPNSLVLIDEIGEGTDPAQGVALAKAILEKLHAGRARTFVTTHFSDLMAFAQIRDGWSNAAMAFDEESMTPTFQLLPGTPGRSSAFAIAARLGLSAELVEAARDFAGGTDTQLEAVIGRLEEERQKWVSASRKAETALAEAEAERERQQEILAELREKKRCIAEAERESLKQELDLAKKEIKAVIAELQAAPSFEAAEKARTQLRRVAEQAEAVLPAVESEPLPEGLLPIDDWDAVPDGAEIFVRALDESGMLLERPDNRGNVRLLMREKKVTVPAEGCFLRRDAKPAPAPLRPRVAVVTHENDGNFTRLDLRGQTGDDAVIETERFLDQALRMRLGEVTIIHGHGTGVLKRLVRDYLRSCPYARSFRPGRRGEGSDGVTVVELDL